MIQLYLNGVATFIENNIVVGDEPNFKQVKFGSTTIFQRRIKRLKVFEFISVHKQNKQNNDITLYHWFFDSMGNYTDMKSQQCKGVECKLGSIKIIDGSPCIYIKKDTEPVYGDFGEEHIPVYTVFDTYNMKIKVLNTSTQDLSFSKQNQLKL